MWRVWCWEEGLESDYDEKVEENGGDLGVSCGIVKWG